MTAPVEEHAVVGFPGRGGPDGIGALVALPICALAFLAWVSADVPANIGRTYDLEAAVWGGLAAVLLGLLLASKGARFSRIRRRIFEVPLAASSAVNLALFATGLILGMNLDSSPLATLGAAYAPLLPTTMLLTAMSVGLFLFGFECLVYEPAAAPQGPVALVLGSANAAVSLFFAVLYVVTMIASFVLIS